MLPSLLVNALLLRWLLRDQARAAVFDSSVFVS